ncbi:hypothetical protein FNF29_01731 [Cafeteria roenbergensis]|uniref:SGNH hydrolase-type esterase domain-containing protein n=1 Tax=Cafeteria roenbergensis TaxID=33653 RepID=A0A5A8CQM7_CAFRO|nr:hypothetical protein FNF29_01731 [Cafeteria roenbergensis]|eukprot:KAA0155356.1 hypothetical protein FNF29_01731 [Cafeteria roenbergensis]
MRGVVVVFGDSITQMGHGEGAWVACLQDAYSRRADFLNRGFSGYTTRSVGPLLDAIFPPEAAGDGGGSSSKPYLLTTVWLGANDAASNDLQHVPLAEFEARLGGIVDRALLCSRAVVVLTPAPVDSAAWPDRSNAASLAYGRAAARVAAARDGATCFDAHAALLEAGGEDWKAMLTDGLHLSRRGGEAVSKGLLSHIEEHHPDVAPGALKQDAPWWRDLDPKDPAAAVAAFLDGEGGTPGERSAEVAGPAAAADRS